MRLLSTCPCAVPCCRLYNHIAVFLLLTLGSRPSFFSPPLSFLSHPPPPSILVPYSPLPPNRNSLERVWPTWCEMFSTLTPTTKTWGRFWLKCCTSMEFPLEPSPALSIWPRSKASDTAHTSEAYTHTLQLTVSSDHTSSHYPILPPKTHLTGEDEGHRQVRLRMRWGWRPPTQFSLLDENLDGAGWTNKRWGLLVLFNPNSRKLSNFCWKSVIVCFVPHLKPALTGHQQIDRG